MTRCFTRAGSRTCTRPVPGGFRKKRQFFHDRLLEALLAGTMKKLHHLIGLSLVQGLASLIKLIGETDGGVLHLLVCRLGTAQEDEILALGNSRFPVPVIQSHADKADNSLIFIAFLFFGHDSFLSRASLPRNLAGGGIFRENYTASRSERSTATAEQNNASACHLLRPKAAFLEAKFLTVL
jgi:hypothetical protein